MVTLFFGAGVLTAGEATWQVGDSWRYTVKVDEFSPYYPEVVVSQTRYTLTLTVVNGAWLDPQPVGAQVWVWTLLVEHDRYGFPVSTTERVYVIPQVAVLRWPLPTLFLQFHAFPPPEAGAAQVGLRWDGEGPAVWERRVPLDAEGAVCEVVHRVVLEPLGLEGIEIGGARVEAQRLVYRAETVTEWAGGAPRRFVHGGTAWASENVKNWVLIEGVEEEDGRRVRAYRLELVL